MSTLRWRERGAGEAPTSPDAESQAVADPPPAPPRPRSVGAVARRLAARAGRAALALAPAVAAGAAASIPVITSTVKAVNAGWVPEGDDGIIATRGWDVLTSHTPNVGQYSEAGLVIHGQVMHSPGPMLYWLIALPARFGSVTSIALTMGIVNSLCIIGCVVLARRRGGLVLMFATAIAIALMCQSLPTESFHDIWNPAAGLFPFLLLIFVGWSLACGEHRLLPLAILDASFLTQTHLMYAAPTAVLLAVGFAGLGLGWWERRRRRRARHRLPPPPQRRIWPWALAAVVVAAACWSLPAIDEVENNPGNLTMIVRTVEHHGSSLGTSVGWNAIVRSIGVRPWWLYVPGTEWDRKYDVGAVVRPGLKVPSSPSGAARDSAIAILGVLGVLALFATFLLQWDLVAAALIGLGMCAAIGLEAASNPSSTLLAGTLGYTMWWGSELGMWVYLVIAWALWLGLRGLSRPAWRALRRRLARRERLPAPRTRQVAVVVASIACLGGTAAVGEAVAATGKPDSHVLNYRPTRTLAADVERIIPPGATLNYITPTLIDGGTLPTEPALRFLLVRHGDRPLSNGAFQRLGAYYTLYDRPVQWTVLLVEGAARHRHWRLAGRVRYNSGFGRMTLSVWVRRVRPARAA